CRNQTNQQRNENGHREHGGRINTERFQRDADQQKDERQRGEQNRERDFVWGLLALRAFHEGNHAVEKTVTLFHRDANDNAVAEPAGSGSNRTAVAAAFADDGRGFASDGGFVHAGDAFDDVAIRGNDVARFTNHDIAFLQIRRRNFFFVPISQSARDGFL